MEELIRILEEIQPGIDYENCNTLIDDRMLDSFDILTLVSEIEDEFEVEIDPTQIIAANSNSAENLWSLINDLKKCNN
jgi:acyl carrier protein